MTSRYSRRFEAAAAAVTGLGLAALTAVVVAISANPSPVTAAAGPAAQSLRGTSRPVTSPQQAAGSAGPDTLATLRAQVHRVPEDWPAWSALGAEELARGRATGEPSAFAAAQQAFDRSLQLEPKGNDAALVGKAGLAASRHDFAAAERLARQALATNTRSPQAQAALTDALTELGRYDEALAAATRLDSLQPGAASFARLSYQAQLRGQTPQALTLMSRAAENASSPVQAAMARSMEGMLRLSGGDVSGAARAWREGSQAAPQDLGLALLAAQLAWAQGNGDLAVHRYADLVARRPTTANAVAEAEVLTALGRTREAAAALAVARTAQQRARTAGIAPVSSDVLFEADYGDPVRAVSLAADLWRRSPSVAAADAYAWALHAAHRDKDARGYADRALALGGRPALVLVHRGTIRAVLGDRAGAIADLKAALATDRLLSPVQESRALALLRRLQAAS